MKNLFQGEDLIRLLLINLFYLKNFLPKVVLCWLDNFQLDCDADKQSCTDPLGVFTRPIGNYEEGDTFAVEHLDPSFKWKTGYMYTFIEALHQLGLQRQEHVFALPYDWRIAVKHQRCHLYDRLTDLVEKAFYSTGNRPVTIIAHSMGGLLGSDFLSTKTNKWKIKFIKEFIAVASPFGGASRSVNDIIVGNSYSVPTVGPTDAVQLVSNFTSVSSLLPQEFSFSDLAIATFKDNVYSAGNISLLFKETGRHSHASFIDWKLTIVDPSKSPGVKMTVFGSVDIPVARKFEFTQGRDGSIDSTPLEFEQGDGTVSLNSMTLVLDHWKKHQKQQVSFIPMSKFEHANYFMDVDFVSILIQYLTN
ncbi:hypothetical protein RCL1_000815 [Eukaryota sp. TZLM3-RCL]